MPRRVRKEGRGCAFFAEGRGGGRGTGREGAGRTEYERGWVLETTPRGVRLLLRSIASTSHAFRPRVPKCAASIGYPDVKVKSVLVIA